MQVRELPTQKLECMPNWHCGEEVGNVEGGKGVFRCHLDVSSNWMNSSEIVMWCGELTKCGSGSLIIHDVCSGDHIARWHGNMQMLLLKITWH